MTAQGTRRLLWKARPVFVSSTFRDMQAERDHLAQIVFPRLEERLRERRHHLEPIDLRVGVDTGRVAGEQDRELLVLKVCFDEIRRSRPYLLVLLGDRYGWVPPQRHAEMAAQEAGFATKLENKSVTALEIEFGLHQGDPTQSRRCLFFLRSPLPYASMPAEVAATYSDAHGTDTDAPRRAEALRQLKETLRNDPDLGDRVHSYTAQWDAAAEKVTGLEAWGEAVFELLWAQLDADTAKYLRQPAPTWEQTQREALAEFVEHRSRGFVGREKIIEELLALATGPAEGTLGACVTGEPGSGKSALFAQVHERLSENEDVLLLAHAAGIGPRSSSVESMLRRWVGELVEHLGIENPLPDKPSPEELDLTFARLVAEASRQRRVVALLDALDQYEPTVRGRRLTWFHAKCWPANARILATAIPGEQAEAFSAWAGIQEFDLPPLGEPEAEEITRQVWARYHRTVNPAVVAALTAKVLPDGEPACGNPLWLTLANEQLNLLDADDFNRAEHEYADLPAGERIVRLLADTVQRLHPDVPGMYQDVLSHAEKVHGRHWAVAFASLIALGRSGWRESDLLVLVPRIAMMMTVIADAREALAAGRDQPEPISEHTRDLCDEIEKRAQSEHGLSLTVAAIRRTFRGHLVRRGSEGQWDLFHAQARKAMTDLVSIDPREIQMVHLEIANYLQSLGWNDPLGQTEIMHHLVESGEARAAANYCCRTATVGLEMVGFDAKTIYSVGSLQAMIKGNPELAQLEAAFSGFSLFDIDPAGAERAFRECVDTLADRIIAMESQGPDGDNPLMDWVISWLDLPGNEENDDDEPSPVYEFELRRFFTQGLTPALTQKGASSAALRITEAMIGAMRPIEDLDSEDTSILYNRSLALHALGEQLRCDGHYEEAVATYRQALDYSNAAVRKQPDSPQYRRETGVSHYCMGAVLREMGDFPEARKELMASLAIYQPLQREDPQSVRPAEDLGWCCQELAILDLATGHPDNAMENWRWTIRWFERAIQLGSQNPFVPRRVAGACLQVGVLCLEAGAPEEAMSVLQQGLETARRSASQDPDCVDSKGLVANIESKLGDCFLMKGDMAAGLSRLEAGLEVREDLYARDPEDESIVRGFLLACIKLAGHHAVRGNSGRTRELLDRFSVVLGPAKASGLVSPSLAGDYEKMVNLTRKFAQDADAGHRTSPGELAWVMMDVAGVLNQRRRQGSPPGYPMSAPAPVEAPTDPLGAEVSDRPVTARGDALPGKHSPSWLLRQENNRAVELLRTHNTDEALAVFLRVLFPGGTLTMRADVPVEIQANYICALLLSQNVEGAERYLDEVQDQSHPRVRALRNAIETWRESLTWTQRLGLRPKPPVRLDDEPGDLL